MSQQRTLEQWLELYGQSHQNKMNKQIHQICVPVIFWTIVSFLFLLQWQNIQVGLYLAILALFFYFRLSLQVGLKMTFVFILGWGLSYWIQRQTGQLFLISVFLFFLAWIGQFIGHKIEGKKPSFFQDLQFLLIGPLWVFKKPT